MTPTALFVGGALVVAIGVPPLKHGELCPAEPPYHNPACDAHTLVAFSTNTGTALFSTGAVAENVTGELHQAPSPTADRRISQRHEFMQNYGIQE